MSDKIDFTDMLLRLNQGDNEGHGEVFDNQAPMEVATHDVCLAYTWAVLTRRRGLAQRLHEAVSVSNFDGWVLLGPELVQAVDEADRTLAMLGHKP